MNVAWSQRARSGLLDIIRYIAQDNPPAARKWFEILKKRAGSLNKMAFRGRVVPEFNRQDIREIIVSPYRVIFRVEDKRVVILAVFEGHRQLRDDDIAGK